MSDKAENIGEDLENKVIQNEDSLEQEPKEDTSEETLDDKSENNNKEGNTEESNEKSDEKSDEESEDLVISFGEDSPPQEEAKEAPSWVKELRKANRELKKQNRELQNKLDISNGIENKPIQLSKKPKLEDFDYDHEEYDKSLQKWYETKIEYDRLESEKKSKELEVEKEWNQRLKDYQDSKNSLKVKDYEEAEFIAQDELSQTQQGMIVQGADNPALLVYALGKNPKKLKELSSISDPVKFAFAVAKMEAQIKTMNKRKPISKPEKRVKSTGGSSFSSIDSTLEKLREEASKTGDFTKVLQYKRQLKSK